MPVSIYAQGSLTLTMTDTYGDGWNGNSIIINDVSYTFSTGYSSVVNIEVDASSCIKIDWVSGSYINETSWTLQDSGGVLAEGADGNYDDEYGVCEMLCSGDLLTLSLYDSYGDTWNDGFLTINEVIYYQPTISSSSNTSSSDTYQISLNLSVCTDIIYTAGNWSNENSWSISDACGNLLSSGGNASGTIGDNCQVPGCTDPLYIEFNNSATLDDESCLTLVIEGCISAWASNYNENANSDNGTCVLDGCMSAWASNYNENATSDDGTCALDGCTSVWASNYNENATSDNGTCILEGCTSAWADNYNENATIENGTCSLLGCILDWADNYNENATSDDGTCVLDGCISAWASNYNENATSDDGTCALDGCTSVWASNYNENATSDNGTCILEGCTSAWADNYNENATIENGTCSLLGCILDWADNYNENATSDDGTCVLDGCISAWASNYNENATSDNGTCILEGCMSAWADNYNENATIENGTCSLLGCMLNWADNYDSNATYQLPNESLAEALPFGSFEMTLDSFLQPMYIDQYSNTLSFNGYTESYANQYIVNCLQGESLDCQAAFQQNQNLDPSIYDYSIQVQACFQDFNSYSCGEAVSMYPDEVSAYLETIQADPQQSEFCLEGSGSACINAAYNLSAYPYQVQSCFMDGLLCDDALDIYPNIMSDVFDFDVTELLSGSLGILIPQTGNYSINYSYSIFSDEEYYYAINSDTTFLDYSVQSEQINFTASVNDILSFGMYGNGLGQFYLSSPIYYKDLGSPTCLKDGCTSDWADNFDALATTEDGTCERLGCTSDWADNFDALATTDDGTCDRLGCTSDWADNYDSLAITENSSCYKNGCMSDWADNYDQIATQDGPSVIDITLLETDIYPIDSDGEVIINTNNFVINGINSGGDLPNGTNQSLTIPILSTGIYTFDWEHKDYDLDGAFYAINFDPSTLINFYNSNEVIVLAQNNTGQNEPLYEAWNGSVEIQLNEGDFITFGVFGEDLCCGIGVLSVENFQLVDNGEGTCFRNGCTDLAACNFDPIATIDDGNCGALMTISSSLSEHYCSEYYWILNDDDNQLIADGICDENIDVCLSEGDYSFSSFNSAESEWWSSWTYVLINEVESSTTFNDLGLQSMDSLEILFTIEFGCNDELAKNYSSTATYNDGSCFYGSCMDNLACNYDSTATNDDGSCIYISNDCQSCDYIHNHYELFENDDDLDGICNEFDISGCTDTLACNFIPNATEDDGSCILASHCSNCESLSQGLNNFGDDDGDGICNENEVYGCVSNSACNFESSATEDDGSCLFSEEGFDCEGNCVSGLELNFGGGSWLNETSFDIFDCNSESILSVEAEEINMCINLPENYTIFIYDSYGDGWNGNTLSIGDSLYELLIGFSDTIDFSCIVPGCNDVDACNFSLLASEDDGSCLYPETNFNCDGTPIDLNNNSIPDSEELDGCLDPFACNYILNAGDQNITLNNLSLCQYPISGYDCESNCLGVNYVLEMVDSYGDGWNGNLLHIEGIEYTIESGSSGTEIICINLTECLFIDFTVGSYISEVSWSLYDDNGTIVSDKAGNILQNYGVFFSDDLGVDYQGVTYNGSFSINNNINCELTSGCIDENALNFNEDAELNDNSCTYPVLGCTDSEADNYNSNADTDNGLCLYSGCTISFATNYNSFASIEDGSCIMPVYGCMDIGSENYNELANTDDGSCLNSGSCLNNEVVVYMNDSYGDGWNGNTLTISSYNLSLEHNSESFTTFSTLDTICIDLNYCNTVTVNGGNWSNEISWTIETLDREVILSGGAPFIGAFGENCQTDELGVLIIDGCMQPIANNYDQYANIQEEAVCLFSENYEVNATGGCDNIIATNYNPGALSFNNDNCIFYGCTNENALNYNSNANIDDGTCFSVGCDYGYVLDCDGSGDCHPSNWIGDGFGDCEDQQWQADLSCYQNDGGDCGGFDPDWNDYPDTLTNWDLWCANEVNDNCFVCQNEYISTNCSTECSELDCVEVIDGYILGCMSSDAVNYNPNATMEDNSCVIGELGCTSEEACNYSESAITDDNSCLFALPGSNCDDFNNLVIEQSVIFSNQQYILKQGDCDFENYFLVADDYYMKGVTYNNIFSSDGMFLEMEHINSNNESLPVLFGDTVYFKINDLYLSSNLNLVSLSSDITKAIKIIIAPKVDIYIGLELDNFDKFNIVGLFDSSTKYLERRSLDNIYAWSDVYSFGSFRVSNYMDYTEINCGCTNSTALNYDSNATENDYSCAIQGCMDPYNSLYNPIANVIGNCDLFIEGCLYEWAFNYNANANVDNGSCINFTYGCIDTLYLDFDSLANTSDGSCQNLIVEGCSDSLYLEYWLYNQTTMSTTQPYVFVNTDDGSCSTLIIEGCRDDLYLEYNESANVENSQMCDTLKIFGCTDLDYIEYDSLANTDDYTCLISKVFGCTDSLYIEFDTLANTLNEDCVSLIYTGCMNENFTEFDSQNNLSEPENCITPVVFGCTDSMFFEFEPVANTDNGTCSTYLVIGCGNPAAINYTLGVTLNDVSYCIFEETYGCTNLISFNYDALADIDDGTCIDVILGCMYDLAFNYESTANTDDASCILVYTGCTDSIMFNFNENANTDDGSCYPVVEGCLDQFMLNYDSLVNTDNESCIPFISGCTDSLMFNFIDTANYDDGSCVPFVYGCMNPTYLEFNDEANTDSGFCSILIIEGCVNILYLEFNDIANTDDGTCNSLIVYGCMNPLYLQFNPIANSNDDSCTDLIYIGCTDELMYNYDFLANVDDGSCFMLIEGCTDPTYLEFDSLSNHDNGTCSVLIVPGCLNDLYLEYNNNANYDDGSCENIVVAGCTNSLYIEFNPLANINDATCDIIIVLGCTDQSMYNYYEIANTDNGSCFSLTSFDLDPLEYQFNMSITAQIEESPGVFSSNLTDSIILISTETNEVSGFGILEYIPYGVNNYYAFITAYSNSLFDNLNVYVMGSNQETNSQIVDNLEFIPNSMLGSISNPWIFSLSNSSGNFGCTDSAAINYSSIANSNDGSCIIIGCLDEDYIEYNYQANQDDGSCNTSWESAYESQSVELNELLDSLSQTILFISELEDSLVNILSIDNTIVSEASLVDYYLDFPEGWSFFGFNCFEAINMMDAFEEVSDLVIIVKDELGSSFLPEFNYNGIGDLTYSEGYQIKTQYEIVEFQFCKILIQE